MYTKYQGQHETVGMHAKQKWVLEFDPVAMYGTDDPDILELYEQLAHLNNPKKVATKAPRTFVVPKLQPAFNLTFSLGECEDRKEVTLSSNWFVLKSTHKIKINGKTVAGVKWENGNLIIHSDKKCDVKVQGKVDCQNLDIKTLGAIDLDAEVKPAQKVSLRANEVTVNKTLSMAKVLEVKADKVRLNSAVLAGHASIEAKHVAVAKDKRLIAPITKVKTDHLQNEGVIKSKLACHLEAQTLVNQGNVTASLVYANVSDQMINEGTLYGAYGIELHGGFVWNKSRIHSKSHVQMEVKNYKSDAEAKLTAKTLLTLSADKFEAKGEVQAKLMVVKAKTLNLHTELKARKLDIEAGRLSLKGVGLSLPERSEEELQDELISGNHSLVVRDGVVIAKGACLNLQQTVSEITGSSKISGELCAKQSQVSLSDVEVQGRLSVDHAALTLFGAAKVKRQGSFSVQHSQWQGGSLASQGAVTVDHCKLTCNGIKVEQGSAHFSYSKVELSQDLATKQKSSLAMDHCALQVQKLDLDGGAKVSQSVLVNDSFSVGGAQSYDHVEIVASQDATIKNGAKVSLKNKSSLKAEQTVHVDGSLAVMQASVQSRAAAIDGSLTLKQGQFVSSGDLSVSKKAQVAADQAYVECSIVNQSGDVAIKRGKLKAQSLEQTSGKLGLNQAVFEVSGDAALAGSLDAKQSDITVDAVEVKGKAKLTATKTEVKGDAKVSGQLDVAGSVVVADQLQVSGKVSADKSGVAISKDVHVEKQAKVHLKNNAQMSATVMHSHGDVSVEQSLLVSDGYDQQAGQLTLKKSVQKLNKGFKQQKSAKIKLDQSVLNAPMLQTFGGLSASKSAIKGNASQLNGAVDLKQSELTFSEQFILSEGGSLTGSNVKLDLNLCQWRGETSLTQSELKATRSAGKGKISLTKSRVAMDEEFRTSKRSNLKLDQTQIQGEKAVFTGKLDADQARIEASVYEQTGQASYNRSAILTQKRLDVAEQAKFKFTNGSIKSEGDLVIGCNPEIHNAEIDVKSYWQESGKLKATKVKVKASDVIHFDKDTQAKLKQVGLSAGALSMWGGLEAELSELNTESASFYSDAVFKQSVMKNEGKLLAAQQSKLALSMQSFLSSRNLDMQGSANLTGNSTLEVIKKMEARVKSQLEVEKSSVVKASSLVSFGDARFDQSLLQVDQLELAHQLKLQHGAAAKVEHLDAMFASKLSVSESAYQGGSANLAGDVTFEKAAIQLEGDLATVANSTLTLKDAAVSADNMSHQGKVVSKGKAAISVKQNLETKTCSDITGDEIAIEGQDFEHYGDITGVKKAAVKVNNLNVHGNMDGRELFLSADNSLYTDGIITGHSITLDGNFITNQGVVKVDKTLNTTSLVFTNYAGGTIYAPNANINTAAYVNAGGVVSAFNLNKNTLIDLNFGVECPSLPSSWDDVFTPSKIFSLAKTAVSAVSAPLGAVMGIGNSLYQLPGQIDSIVQQAKGMKEGGWENFRFRQAIPAVCSIKNIAVSTVNNAQGLYNLGQQAHGFVQGVKQDGFDMDAAKSDLAGKFTWDTAMQVGQDAMGIFMPMHHSESLFSVNGGVQASYNINKTDLVGVNLGGEFGLGNVVHNSYFQYNAGATVGTSVSLSARHFKTDGYTYGANRLHFEFGDAEIAEGATFNGDGRISGKVDGDLTILGESKLKQDPSKGQGKVEVKGTFTVAGENSDVAFSGVETKAKQAELAAKFELSESAVLDADHTHIGKQGVMQTDATSKHFGKTVHNEGVNVNAGVMAQVVRDESGKVISMSKMESYTNAADATTVLGGAAAVQNLHNQSTLLGLGAASITADTFSQDAGAETLLTDHAVMQGEKAQVAGVVRAADQATYGIEDTQLTENSKLTIDKEAKHLGRKVHVAAGAQYDVDGFAGNITKNAQGEVVLCSMDQVTVAEKGQAKVTGVVMTKELNNASTVNVDHGQLAADKYQDATGAELKVENQGQVLGDKANIQGKVSIAKQSTMHIKSADIARGGELTVDQTSRDLGLQRDIKGKYQNAGLAAHVTTNERGEAVYEHMDQVTIEKGGEADLTGRVFTRNMHNKGAVKAQGATIVAEDYKEDIGATTSLKDKTHLSGKKASFAGNSSVESNSAINVEQSTIEKGAKQSIDESSRDLGQKRQIHGEYENKGLAARVVFDEQGEAHYDKMEQVTVESGGKATLTGAVYTQELQNKGAVEANGADVTADHYKEERGATTTLSNKARLNGKEATFAGNSKVEKDSAINVAHSTIEKQGKQSIDASSRDLGDKRDIKGVYDNSGLAARVVTNDQGERVFGKMQQVNVEQGGEAKLQGTMLTENMTNKGQARATGAEIVADQYTEEKGAKTTLTENTQFHGKKASLAGESNIEKSSHFNVSEVTLEQGGQQHFDSTSRDLGSKREIKGTYNNDGLAGQVVIGADGKAVIGKMDEMNVAKSGQLNTTGDVLATQLNNAGKVAAKGASLQVETYADQKGAELKLSEKSRMKGARAIVQGNMDVAQSSTVNVDDVSVENGGQYTVDETSQDFGNKRAIKDGKYHNKGVAGKVVVGSDGKAAVGKMDQFDIGAKGHAQLDGTALVANMSNQGQVSSKAGKLRVGHLVQSDAGTTQLTEGAVYSGQTADVGGELKVESDSKAFVDQLNVKQHAKVNVSKSSLQTKATHNEGKIHAQDAYIKADKLTQTKTGETEAERSTLVAEKASLSGKMQVKDGSVFNAEHTTVNKDGQFVLQDSQHQGKTLEVEGDYKTQGKLIDTPDGKQATTAVILEQKMHVAKGGKAAMDTAYVSAKDVIVDGKMKSKDLTVKSTNATVNGDWNYEGQLSVEAKNQFATGNQSRMQGHGDSKFDLKAKKESMQGKHQGRSMRFDVEQVEDVEGLIQGDGRYANLQTDNLAVKTDKHVSLKKNNRGAGTSLDVEAASIKVEGDMQTSGLHLKANKGSVSIDAKVSAKATNNGGDGSVHLEAEKDVHIGDKNQFAGSLNFRGRRGRFVARPSFGKKEVAVTASNNVTVEAKGNFLNRDAQVKAGKDVSVKAKTVKNIRSTKDAKTEITGQKVFLEATDGDVDNNARVDASQFLSVRAHNGSVKNEAFQYDERGRYQQIRRHDAAVMSGGSGTEETQGIGTYIEADKKVINSASTIEGNADVHVHGKEGVETKAAHFTYVNDKWDRREGFFGQTHIRGYSTKTEVYDATIQSTNGKNVVTSEQGEVNSVGTKFMSPGGTEIHAKQDVNLKTLKYEDRRIERKNQGFGLKLNRDASYDQGGVETVIATLDGDIKIRSDEGGVNAIGARVLGTKQANLIVDAKKDIVFVEEKLKHRTEQQSEGFDLEAVGIKASEGNQAKNLGEFLRNTDPLLQAIAETAEANSDLAQGAGYWNTGVEGKGLYDQLTANAEGDGALEKLADADFAGAALNRVAKATLSFSKEKTTSSSESRGPGSIDIGGMHHRSREGNVVLGMDTNVEDASIRAKKFIQQATALESSRSHEKNSVSTSVGAGGQSYGASHSHMKEKNVEYVNNSLNVNRHLEVNAEEWVMDGANTSAGTLGGKVKKLTITDKLDSHEARGESYGASTDGNVSVGKTDESRRRVNKSSGLNVREGINKEEGPQFTADETEFNGAGQITSDGENHYEKTNPNIKRNKVEEYDRANSYHVSANPNAIVDGEKTQASVSVHHKDYRATLDENGRTVHKDEEQKVRLQLPVPAREKEQLPEVVDVPQENLAAEQGELVVPQEETPVLDSAPVETQDNLPVEVSPEATSEHFYKVDDSEQSSKPEMLFDDDRIGGQSREADYSDVLCLDAGQTDYSDQMSKETDTSSYSRLFDVLGVGGTRSEDQLPDNPAALPLPEDSPQQHHASADKHADAKGPLVDDLDQYNLNQLLTMMAQNDGRYQFPMEEVHESQSWNMLCELYDITALSLATIPHPATKAVAGGMAIFKALAWSTDIGKKQTVFDSDAYKAGSAVVDHLLEFTPTPYAYLAGYVKSHGEYIAEKMVSGMNQDPKNTFTLEQAREIVREQQKYIETQARIEKEMQQQNEADFRRNASMTPAQIIHEKLEEMNRHNSPTIGPYYGPK